MEREEYKLGARSMLNKVPNRIYTVQNRLEGCLPS
jgi:hypothetical protein